MPLFDRVPDSPASLARRFRAQRLLGLARRAVRRLAAGNLAASAPPAPAPAIDATTADGPARVLVVDAHAPRPDIDSGSVRMVALLRILADLGLPAALFVDDFRPGPVDAPLVATDVRDVRAAIDWIQRHRAQLQLVVLSRLTVAEHWLPLVRRLLPGVPVVFDTVDLHFVREQREADARGSSMLRCLARRTRRAELALVRSADRTWVVSGSERERLLAQCPGAGVDCVSNIVDARPGSPPMGYRRDFIFVGNYRHAPNVDAVRWLQSLWPSLHARCPEARLLLVGPFMPGDIAARVASLPATQVLGHVAELEPHLLAARVMLAPLRYGAGVKGKINAAFACGLPVVATRCAIEGMQDGDEPVALVADEDAAFVEQAARLYSDADLWARVQASAAACLERKFSGRAARSAVVESLRALDVRGLSE